MVRYKVVARGKNIFRKETFKTKRDAQEAIYFTNKGARLLNQVSAARNARIVKVRR